MTHAVYRINKGVNQAICFKGFQGQYVAYAAIGMVLLLLLCAVMFLIGVSPYICLMIVLILGFLMIRFLLRMSRIYGQFGLIKMLARRKMPHTLKAQSRSLFMELKDCFKSDTL